VSGSGGEIVPALSRDIDFVPLFQRALVNVREEVADNPYIDEAIRVLSVQGYRSAIGCFWNAVVDDLRNKIVHRSLSLFNKEAGVGREVKRYEDFQNFVNDDQLIEGAYKIGVIGWEASKILKHAKETRHIFDGHPRSSEPSVIKVLAMFDDCIRYVLNEPYPSPIVDLDEYITTMDSTTFDRNEIACANALTELPETYKDELAHRLFSVYVHPNTSSTLRSNVEFVAPIVWPVLPKATKLAVVRRVDTVINQGDAEHTARAFNYVNMVGANAYLSPTARYYQIKPLVDELKNNLDNWDVENKAVRALAPYAANIPADLLVDYVGALTKTYVGYMGSSLQYNRRDFYANGAGLVVPDMFVVFDDAAAAAFVDCIKMDKTLRRRIETPQKLARLRSLANIVLDRVSGKFPDRNLLELLADETKTAAFYEQLPKLP
jgi:hypothetical protein